MNILVRGGTPFRLLERQEHHAYPAGHGRAARRTSRPSEPEETGGEARERYADLLETLTEERPEQDALAELSAYEMAASVDIDLEVKQGLLELRSEEAAAAAAGAPFQGRHQERRACTRGGRPRVRQRQGRRPLASASVDDDRGTAAARVAGAGHPPGPVPPHGLRSAEVEVQPLPAHHAGSRGGPARPATRG